MAKRPTEQRKKQGNISESAYQRIRAMIVTERLAPATAVDTQQLTRQLGVGKTPIREALQRLALERLIVISPRRGTFVSDLGIAQLEQAFEARVLIEGRTAHLAAMRTTDDELNGLKNLFLDVDDIAAQHDYLRAILLDEKFHRTVAEISCNEYLVSFLNSLNPMSQRLWYHMHVRRHGSPIDTRQILVRHMEIVDALASRDPRKAEEAMVRHILRFREEAFKLIGSA